MESVWESTVKFKKREPMPGDFSTDVLIIGGGITGILCAYKLKQAGVSCRIVEAETLCSGITKNTTAKITSQHGLIYDSIIRRFGTDAAKKYFEAARNSISQYRDLSVKINCDFEEKDAYIYSKTDLKKLLKERTALEKIGCESEFYETLPLPVAIVGAIKIPHQAQFNPLKLLAALSEELDVYEHSRVTEITDDGALTQHGKIKAKKIIVATHFPFANKHGSYFLKQYQHRSYVIAFENAPDLGGMFNDENNAGLSFRNYNGMLLIGGGGGRTGKSAGGWNEILQFAHENFPKAKEKYRFATQDCMTLDGIPYIGKYSKNTPDCLVATGFNTWGMTNAMTAANILTDAVLGRENPLMKIFSPSRSIIRPQLAVNAFESAAGLLTFSKKRCPHLGCALKWNVHEHSWDCPCHGSRFTEDGRLIDNPATGDLPK